MILATRQSGKTETCVLLGNHVAHTEPGETVVVISPAQRISSEFIRRAKQPLHALARKPIWQTTPCSVSSCPMDRASSVCPVSPTPCAASPAFSLVLLDEAASVSAMKSMPQYVPCWPSIPRGQLIGLTTGAAKRGLFLRRMEQPELGFRKDPSNGRHVPAAHARIPGERNARRSAKQPSEPNTALSFLMTRKPHSQTKLLTEFLTGSCDRYGHDDWRLLPLTGRCSVRSIS